MSLLHVVLLLLIVGVVLACFTIEPMIKNMIIAIIAIAVIVMIFGSGLGAFKLH